MDRNIVTNVVFDMYMRFRLVSKSMTFSDLYKRVVLKIANFRCHGNKGLSEPNVTGIVELADPENHTIEPKITTILYATEVMANFLVKFPIFHYHGNRGCLSKVWLTPLNWPRPKTP